MPVQGQISWPWHLLGAGFCGGISLIGYLLAAVLMPAAMLGAAVLCTCRSCTGSWFNETVHSHGMLRGNALTVVMPQMLGYARVESSPAAGAGSCGGHRVPGDAAETSGEDPAPGDTCCAWPCWCCLSYAAGCEATSRRIGSSCRRRRSSPCWRLSVPGSCSAGSGRRGYGSAWVWLGALLYCYAAMGLCLRGIDRRLLADIQQGRRSQDSFYAYYEAYYEPRQATDDLRARWEPLSTPLFLYEAGDHVALNKYLQRGPPAVCRGRRHLADRVQSGAVDLRCGGLAGAPSRTDCAVAAGHRVPGARRTGGLSGRRGVPLQALGPVALVDQHGRSSPKWRRMR